MKLDWKATVGVAITVFLMWWILRDVPFAEVWAHLREAHWGLLLASVTVATSGFLIRAMRWKVLLQPVRRDTGLRNRFAAVNIGFMANNLLPARVGEFARAYALSRLEPIPVSAALGSLVVERFFDALVLLGILLVSVSSPAFPAVQGMGDSPLGRALDAVLVLVGALVVVLAVLLLWPKRVVRWAERLAATLPGDFARPVVDSLEAFLDSLAVLRSPRLFILAAAWSVGFWLWHGLSFWLGLLAFDIHAGPTAAYFTEAVVGFGVAIPSAPGFFGTFHASAGWALSVFGVPDASSLAFAFGYHLGGFIPVTVIGLYYAGRIGLSLKDVGASETRVEEAVERTHPGARRMLGGVEQVERVSVLAPAKVNLALRVGARRGDGYHEIETLFQAVDLCDRLELRREGEGIELEVEGEDAGPLSDNLVLRATRAFLEAADIEAEPRPGLRMRLEKRIPAGAGLGGGSSDAAAALLALERLFPAALPPGRLTELAAELGSDVPFFLAARPLALGRGRGERLEPLEPLPALPVVLVVPTVRVATADAYATLARLRAGTEAAPPPPLGVPDAWEDVAARATNDFDRVAMDGYPPVGAALAALRDTGPMLALLSGSGAASFALYRTDQEAADAVAELAGREGLRVLRVRTLTVWPDRT